MLSHNNNIALFVGGTSPEREVSKSSGKSILKALHYLGYKTKIIDPAAAAKNMSWNINSTLAIGAIIAAVSVIAGLFIANYYSLAAGPSIIIFAGLIFLGSLLFRKD